MPQEGQTAIGPNGQRAVFRGGQWVVASGAPQMPADPTFDLQRPKVAAEVDKTRTDIVDTRADNVREDRKVGEQIATERVSRRTAGLPAGYMWDGSGERVVQIPGYVPPKGEGGDMQANLKGADLDTLVTLINQAQAAYEAGPGSTSGLRGIMDWLPTEANALLDQYGANIADVGKAAFRVPGSGDQNASEVNQFLEANSLSSGVKDIKLETRLANMRERVNNTRKALGLPPAKWEGVPEVEAPQGSAMDQLRLAGGDPLQAAAFGATEGLDKYPPEMVQAHEALVGRLMMQGGGRIDPQAYAEAKAALASQFPGFAAGDPQADMEWASGVNDYLAQGGKTVPGDIQPPSRDLSYGEQVRNNMATSPEGAFLAGMGDMGSMGAVSALAGDQFAAMSEDQPLAMAAGQIGGAITGTGILGGVARYGARKVLPQELAGRILETQGKARFGRTLATDTAYSGGYGAVTGQNPLETGAFGAGGSAIGQGAGKLVGKAVGGVTQSAPVQAMRARGIPITAGRLLGDTTSKIEDKMVSWPFVGDMVRRRHEDSFRGLERAMFDEGGKPIGFRPGSNTVGREGVDQFRTAKGQAYDRATDGVSVPVDGQFGGDLVNVASARNQLPDHLHPRFDRMMENHTKGIQQTGMLSGDAYQRAMRGLKTARGKAGTVAEEFEEPYREAVTLGMDAFDGLMRRGGGEDVVQGLNAANAGHKNFKIIEDAIVTRARNGTRSGEVGLPAPSQWVDAAAASERKYGPNTLRPIAEDAQRVLPSSVPNSGTADRMQMAGMGLAGLGAVGGGEAYATGDMSTTGKIAAALALLTAGGTKVGQKALVKALADRPEALQTAGKIINTRKGLFGRAALPFAVADY